MDAKRLAEIRARLSRPDYVDAAVDAIADDMASGRTPVEYGMNRAGRLPDRPGHGQNALVGPTGPAGDILDDIEAGLPDRAISQRRAVEIRRVQAVRRKYAQVIAPTAF